MRFTNEKEHDTTMDKEIKRVAELTGLPVKKVYWLMKRDVIQRIEYGQPYYRFRHKHGKILKGTVVFPEEREIVQGFPKIRRLYTLKEGLRKYFPDGFYAEEKLDGYNVRTVLVGGEQYSLTRGGIICPYTTERIKRQEKQVTEFLEENPEKVLCGEVIGLENPYQEKSYPEAKEFGYYIFDVRDKKTNKPLPVEERRTVLEEHGVKQVPLLGLFKPSDWKKLLTEVRKLGDQGREGVVLKSPDSRTIIKYTSNQNTNRDLEYAFRFYSDYGQAFFFRRIVREAFQAWELGLEGKALEEEAARLGKSIMLPMVQTIQEIASGREVTEDFRITVPSKKLGQEFIRHLEHLGIVIRVNKIEKTNEGYKFWISRRYQSTNDKTKHYLEGGLSEE